jgi:hypothetical protein
MYRWRSSVDREAFRLRFVVEKKPTVQLIPVALSITHGYAVASKTPNPILIETLFETAQVVNFIKKNREIITRLSFKRCVEMVSEQRAIPFHSEIRCLSRGSFLKGLFEHRHEVYW